MERTWVLVFMVIVAIDSAACGDAAEPAARAATALTGTTIVAAGDIATPASNDTATSNLVVNIDPALVVTLGDNAYEDGTLSQFRSLYDPTWGRFKSKTFPSPGNHEYHVTNARGYVDYFGVSTGLHSRVVGNWLIISVDSETNLSGQVTALRNLLARDNHTCEMAFWHRPRWSSGAVHGSIPGMQGLWAAAVAGGVDVVLNAHDHNYQRFAPMNANGAPATNGTREFVVGTGGGSLYDFTNASPAPRVKIKAFGVLKMTLAANSYQWEFHKVGRGTGTIADSGTGTCH